MKEVPLSIQKLVDRIAQSPESSFYRDRWKGADRFTELPTVSRDDFLATPLEGRRYKRTRGVVKLVKTANGSFFSKWDKDDIAGELYGTASSRPLVYFADSNEGIEKALWCYLRGSVPLIGERNEEVSLYMARDYHVNQLLADEASLLMLLPHLSTLPEKLESVLIFGDSFDGDSLSMLAQYSRDVHLVLSLPEMGMCAAAPLSADPVFRASPDCCIERDEDNSLVLTKSRFLTTPVIRYKSHIVTKDAANGMFRLAQRQ